MKFYIIDIKVFLLFLGKNRQDVAQIFRICYNFPMFVSGKYKDSISLTAHGSRLTAHGSRLTAHGSRLILYIQAAKKSTKQKYSVSIF
jgi:hypothetical protein